MDGTLIGNSIIPVSKKLMIPTFSLISFTIQADPIDARYRADYLCVYGNQALEALSSIGFSKNNIILTGNPRYDSHLNVDLRKAKKILENNYDIDSKKKLIILGFGRWIENDEIWMSKLIRFCNENNFEIVIKVKPLDMPGAKEHHEQMIKKIKTRCEDLKYKIVIDIDTNTLLGAADLVITNYSNLSVEAAILKKPIVHVNFIGESINAFTNLVDFENALYTENYNELEKLIKEIFVDNKHFERLAKSRDYITNNFNIYNDGKSSTRIYEILIGGNYKTIK